MKTNGDFSSVNLTIRPMKANQFETAETPLFLVILEEAQPPVLGAGGSETNE